MFLLFVKDVANDIFICGTSVIKVKFQGITFSVFILQTSTTGRMVTLCLQGKLRTVSHYLWRILPMIYSSVENLSICWKHVTEWWVWKISVLSFTWIFRIQFLFVCQKQIIQHKTTYLYNTVDKRRKKKLFLEIWQDWRVLLILVNWTWKKNNSNSDRFNKLILVSGLQFCCVL